RIPIRAKARQMLLIRAPYFSIFLTKLLDNRCRSGWTSNEKRRAPRVVRNGAARPLDDLALPRGRAGRLLLPALRAPDRGRRRTHSRQARRRRGAPLPLRLWRDHSAGA